MAFRVVSRLVRQTRQVQQTLQARWSSELASAVDEQLKASLVARGFQNTDNLIEAIRDMPTTMKVDDELTWGDMSDALEESQATCQDKLGFAYDLLSLQDLEPDFVRPSVAACLQHVIQSCGEDRSLQSTAQHSLGMLVLQGIGVEPNDKISTDLFAEASKAGHPYAMHLLGTAFYTGRGIKQSDEKAVALFKTAAGKSVPEANAILGSFYRDGLCGLPQDYELAVQYLEQAIELGDPMAKADLAPLYNSGNGVELDHVKAYELNKEAAEESRSPLAYHNLACHFFLGKGVQQDFEIARETFLVAANLGFAHSAFNLGNIYLKGLGVPVDLDEAERWFDMAQVEVPQATEALKEIAELRKQA
eukprot:m.11075 g.11075  ORF g.11075 m.11075 type:complete len:362 (-) comp5665_c0_seq1:1025-2110(-)